MHRSGKREALFLLSAHRCGIYSLPKEWGLGLEGCGAEFEDGDGESARSECKVYKGKSNVYIVCNSTKAMKDRVANERFRIVHDHHLHALHPIFLQHVPACLLTSLRALAFSRDHLQWGHFASNLRQPAEPACLKNLIWALCYWCRGMHDFRLSSKEEEGSGEKIIGRNSLLVADVAKLS